MTLSKKLITNRKSLDSMIHRVLEIHRRHDWGLKVGAGDIDRKTTSLVFITNDGPNSTPIHVDWTPARNGGVAVIAIASDVWVS